MESNHPTVGLPRPAGFEDGSSKRCTWLQTAVWKASSTRLGTVLGTATRQSIPWRRRSGDRSHAKVVETDDRCGFSLRCTQSLHVVTISAAGAYGWSSVARVSRLA